MTKAILNGTKSLAKTSVAMFLSNTNKAICLKPNLCPNNETDFFVVLSAWTNQIQRAFEREQINPTNSQLLSILSVEK